MLKIPAEPSRASYRRVYCVRAPCNYVRTGIKVPFAPSLWYLGVYYNNCSVVTPNECATTVHGCFGVSPIKTHGTYRVAARTQRWVSLAMIAIIATWVVVSMRNAARPGKDSARVVGMMRGLEKSVCWHAYDPTYALAILPSAHPPF